MVSVGASAFGTVNLPKISHGQGSYVYDNRGKQSIDGSGGPAVFCLGHGNAEVNEAIAQQLAQVAHGYRYLFTSDPLEDLTAMVARRTDNHFRNAVFVTGGSEAVESCLKIALQYFAAQGRPEKCRFVARRRSWHGNTLGALSVSDFLERQRSFKGSLLPVSRVSAANLYRAPEGLSPEAYSQSLAQELEEEIERTGPDKVCAFIFEPVVGAAGGVVPPPPGYAALVREVCERHDVLMIADEVMCGAGRCGSWRALAPEGVRPDIMAVAKGLGGGYLPLGAALYNDRIAGLIRSEHGAVQTGHTFSAHTTACAAALMVQRIMERDHLIERVRTKGASFLEALRESLSDLDEIGDVRGRGYFIGIELVKDRKSKQPFPAALKLSQSIGTRSLEEGLICYPCQGNVDGVDGDTVILAPPYNASDSELEEIIDKQTKAMKAAVTSVAHAA
jgi:adenosylmethionine-8-amino-7-oxononanoate aminotransferase